MVGGQRPRIESDSHRPLVTAVDAHQSDARQLRYFLREPRFRDLLDLGQSQGRRGDRKAHDRRVSRIDLGVGGRVRQVRRKEIARRIDCGLNLLLGDVEAEIQPELQRDDGGPGGARRRHLGQSRHLAQLALQGRRHRRHHHFRACAWEKGLHLDGRVIDVRERRQGEEGVGGAAADQKDRHQEPGGHWTKDERPRGIYLRVSRGGKLRCWLIACAACARGGRGLLAGDPKAFFQEGLA